MTGHIPSDGLTLSNPLVLRPRIGEPGSAFQVGEPGANQGYTEHTYTEEAQLLAEFGVGGARVVHGAQKLITANLRNLSEYLVASGVEVKAWSFFSGELPGAEMIHQAEQEPEDVLNLAGSRSFEELYVERASDQTLHLDPAELWQNMVTQLRSKSVVKRAYLVDDWLALRDELESRKSITTWGHTALGAMLFTERTQLFACVSEDTPLPMTDYSFPMATHRNMGLLRFEGYETSLRPQVEPSFAPITTV